MSRADGACDLDRRELLRTFALAALGVGAGACVRPAVSGETHETRGSSVRTLYVLTVEFSESGKAVLAKARGDFADHRARMSAFHAQGTLLLSGAFQEPDKPLVTMGIFTTRTAAEEFAREDPFIVKGLAGAWHVREWQEVLTA